MMAMIVTATTAKVTMVNWVMLIVVVVMMMMMIVTAAAATFIDDGDDDGSGGDHDVSLANKSFSCN